MKYTSLSHNDRGYNTQLDFTSVESWLEYCEKNKDIVWSRLFKNFGGILTNSYISENYYTYLESKGIKL